MPRSTRALTRSASPRSPLTSERRHLTTAASDAACRSLEQAARTPRHQALQGAPTFVIAKYTVALDTSATTVATAIRRGSTPTIELTTTTASVGTMGAA